MGRWFVMFEKGCQDKRRRSVDVEKQSERRTETKRYAMTASSSDLWGHKSHISLTFFVRVHDSAGQVKSLEALQGEKLLRDPHFGRRHRMPQRQREGGVTVGGQSEWGGVAEQSWQQLGSDLTKSDQGSDAVQEFNAKGESGRGVKSESWC
jgi:hypothetical protein